MQTKAHLAIVVPRHALLLRVACHSAAILHSAYTPFGMTFCDLQSFIIIIIDYQHPNIEYKLNAWRWMFLQPGDECFIMLLQYTN